MAEPTFPLPGSPAARAESMSVPELDAAYLAAPTPEDGRVFLRELQIRHGFDREIDDIPED